MNKTIDEIKRYNPSIDVGLTTGQVKERINSGLINVDKNNHTKSTAKIIRDNCLTLFNLINFILALAILFVGSYRNLLFMGVVVSNALIGIIQELRTKRTLDKLNLISSQHVYVVRDGEKFKIDVEKVVLDDIVFFDSGKQVITDCIIKDGTCEVNESLLTGEPDLITKKVGDKLLSGSYVVSGECFAKVENVGEDTFSSKILKGSKLIKKSKSEIMKALNKIVKVISIAIIPIGAILFYRQFMSSDFDLKSSVVSTAAALTGMIPEGLVLLTSSVLAVGVVRLSKNKVLVQDIYCLETLARVDTLCLDKTGTITEGTFDFSKIVPMNGYSEQNVEQVLKYFSSNLNDSNETFKTIQKNFLPDKNYAIADKKYPFSSERKWSGIHIPSKGSYVFGASEFIFGDTNSQLNELVKQYSRESRVLVLGHSDNEFEGNKVPICTKPMALVLVKDKIRYNAQKTLDFFKRQGVEIKIISGDNALTVSQIAQRVNLKNGDSYVDATKLRDKKDVSEAALKYTVFGRVTPSQKQDIIKSLKENGHTVAMVGDGVNDVLALKESDCSVAMANGSDIAKNVSHLVLLDSNFASMPKAVAEGRKVINNLQRSSSLFLVKTMYSCILAVLFFLISAPYPFIPIQMTLLSSLTIGIPSFILGLEPNRERIKGSLLKNIFSKSLPTALTIVANIMICVLMYSYFNVPQDRYYTLTVISTGFLGILLLYKISLPLNRLRKILISCVSAAMVYAVIKYSSFFEIEPLNLINVITLIPLILLSIVIYEYMVKIDWQKIFRPRKKAKL